MAENQPLMTLDDDDDNDEDIAWIREASMLRPTAHENTDSTNVKRIDNSPSIPEGMRYHLFISHSNDNEEEVAWAERVVHTMEQGYGFKCLWPSRDFTPGHEIATLIQNGIASSMKILCVLTPDSLNSGWCEYERNMAFVLSVQERKNRVIPLLLEECEVPDIFKTINYIDVPKGEDYIHRIQRCFDQHMDMKDIIPKMEYIFQRQDDTRNNVNGEQPCLVTNSGLQIKIYAVKHHRFIGVAWSFPDQPYILRAYLNIIQARLCEDAYTNAKDIANKSRQLKWYSVTNSKLRSTAICICIVLTFIWPVVFVCDLIEIGQNKLFNSNTYIYLIFGIFIGICTCVLFCMGLFNAVIFRRSYRRIVNFSLQQVMQTNVLVTYQRNICGPPVVSVILKTDYCSE